MYGQRLGKWNGRDFGGEGPWRTHWTHKLALFAPAASTPPGHCVHLHGLACLGMKGDAKEERGSSMRWNGT